MVEQPDAVGVPAARVEDVPGLELAGPHQGGRRAARRPEPPPHVRQAEDEGAFRLQHLADHAEQAQALRPSGDVRQNPEGHEREIERPPVRLGQRPRVAVADDEPPVVDEAAQTVGHRPARRRTDVVGHAARPGPLHQRQGVAPGAGAEVEEPAASRQEVQRLPQRPAVGARVAPVVETRGDVGLVAAAHVRHAHPRLGRMVVHEIGDATARGHLSSVNPSASGIVTEAAATSGLRYRPESTIDGSGKQYPPVSQRTGRSGD